MAMTGRLFLLPASLPGDGPIALDAPQHCACLSDKDENEQGRKIARSKEGGEQVILQTS